MFCVHQKSKTATATGQIKNIFNLFMSKTTEPFDSKLSWNVPWVVLYKMCAYWKLKMATTTGQI